MKKQKFSKVKVSNFLNQFIPTLDLTQSDKDLQNVVRNEIYSNFEESQGLVDFINWKSNSYIVKFKYNNGQPWGLA
jgi:hypothetical protein